MEEKELSVIENKDVATQPVGDFPTRDLAKIMKASSPYDTILDSLAVQDKYIYTPDGIPIRVDRMTYIANFLTQNIIEQQTEEVPEYDEESGEMKPKQIQKEVMNMAYMKALNDFLKLKPKEEEKDNTQQHKLDTIIAMLLSKRGKGDDGIEELIAKKIKDMNLEVEQKE
jgi:hypothetical protein